MTWGDVLIAAIDACAAVGPEAEVQPKSLPKLIQQLIAVSGGMAAVRSAPRLAQLRKNQKEAGRGLNSARRFG
ncbi:MAG: hypothetical protein ACK4HD_07385 [Pannonibacter phragmitetus]